MVAGHDGFTISDLPSATRSNSPRSSLDDEFFNSRNRRCFIGSKRFHQVFTLRVTEPTVMVGFSRQFLRPTGRDQILSPANSGSQKRRVEQWKTSTPAAKRLQETGLVPREKLPASR